MPSTRLKIYQVVFNPTSSRKDKDGNDAYLQLKIEDPYKATTYWSSPLSGQELTNILMQEHDMPQHDSSGIKLATALINSAAFNFQSKSDPEGSRKPGQPAIVKRPIAELQDFGRPDAKVIDGVRITRFAATDRTIKAKGIKTYGLTEAQVKARKLKEEAEADKARRKQKMYAKHVEEMDLKIDVAAWLKDL